MTKTIYCMMNYLLSFGAIAYSLIRIRDSVRTMRYQQWFARRNELTVQQFIQSLEAHGRLETRSAGRNGLEAKLISLSS
jgi:hypothetical protein